MYEGDGKAKTPEVAILSAGILIAWLRVEGCRVLIQQTVVSTQLTADISQVLYTSRGFISVFIA